MLSSLQISPALIGQICCWPLDIDQCETQALRSENNDNIPAGDTYHFQLSEMS